MSTSTQLVNKVGKTAHLVIISNKDTDWSKIGVSDQAGKFLQKNHQQDINPACTVDGNRFLFSFQYGNEKNAASNESWRRLGAKVVELCNIHKLDEIILVSTTDDKSLTSMLLEGTLLSNYQFKKYKKKKPFTPNALEKVKVLASSIDKGDLEHTLIITEATIIARDLVNEPLSYLTAEQLSAEIKKLGNQAKFKTEMFNKAKIRSLKMGGLIAVNLGSPNPPTFNILEWKPKKAVNKKPIVLVGKGVVYDTGGLSLKPTPNSMDFMKADMGGAAAVIGATYAVAKAQLPVHIITLVPATENRPGGNAYVPGDVITMHSGMTVEVLNTDAEGRMILADALSYAKKYQPELVLDFATLTGAADRAIGPQGICYMGHADDEVKAELSESGYNVHERLVEFPMWKEYADSLKSDIADIKNIGGPRAGMITAGIFLQNFTDYPWLHFDIAGSAFLDRPDGYRLKNGTGVGVRLLFDYFKKRAKS